MTANLFKDENIKLRTKVHILEGELLKKERLIDDLLLQQDGATGFPGMPGSSTNKSQKGMKQLESHLTLNLKRKIKDISLQVQSKNEEIEALKRNIKSTKISELESECKMYMDECTRLRHQLEEVIKSKDTFADPEELRVIEEKF